MKSLFLTLFLLCSVSAFGQNTERDTINFDLWDYICFNGTFEGDMHGRFIFDTGAGSTIIDSTFFAHAYPGGMAGDSVIVRGVGNSMQKALYINDTMRFCIDGVDCVSTKTAVLNLNNLLPGVDGVLGIGIFGERPYKINYCDEQITFLTARDVKQLDEYGFEKIDLLPSAENFLSVEMTMVFDSSHRKTIKTLAHIDTGNPETLDLTPSVGLRRHIFDVSPGSFSFDLSSLGIGGEARLTLVKCQAIQIGGQTVKMSAFGIIEDQSRDTTRKSNGILGNEFMLHFDFVVDIAHRAIYLRPNKWFYKVARVNYSGFLVAPTEAGYFVNGLSNRAGGMRHNDLITHIDNKPILELNWWDIHMFFTTADLSYTLRIEREGEVKNVKIKNANYQTLWQ